MATVNFFTKGKNNPTTIYVRFVSGRKTDLKQSTSLNIDPKYWNKNKGSVRPIAEFKGKQDLEKALYDLNGEILHQYRKDYANGVIINSEWLNRVILNFFDQDKDLQTELLTDYAEYHLKNLPHKVLKNGNTGVQQSTFKKYKSNIVKLKKFETFKKKRFLLNEVNMDFHREYISFLKNEENLNYNSIGKHLTIAKTICLDANATKGIKISDTILNGKFRTTKEATSFVTLSEKEIDQIFNIDLSKTSYLDNARNWLIIGVWLGARVSDLLNLSRENIKGNYLEYTAKKTGQKIVMPMHWQVSATLDKLNGDFPYNISNQKFNDYIKIVCREAGINEMVPGTKRIEIGKTKTGQKIWRKVAKPYLKSDLVSTHICRRSFATNHYGKLPTPVIMSATGHTTEKMLLSYIGKAPTDNANVLMEYWKIVKAKQDKEPQLTMIKNAN